MKFLREKNSTVYLDIVVVPNARKTEIIGEYNERLKIKIHAPPVEGKANEEIIRFLAEFFGVARKNFKIIRGELGKQKTIEMSGLTLAQFSKILSS